MSNEKAYPYSTWSLTWPVSLSLGRSRLATLFFLHFVKRSRSTHTAHTICKGGACALMFNYHLIVPGPALRRRRHRHRHHHRHRICPHRIHKFDGEHQPKTPTDNRLRPAARASLKRILQPTIVNPIIYIFIFIFGNATTHHFTIEFPCAMSAAIHKTHPTPKIYVTRKTSAQ